MNNNTITKYQVVKALRLWINQRPGLEFANYGDVSAYRAEQRSIAKDRVHARELLAYAASIEGVTAEMLIQPLTTGGRLTLGDDGTLSYCTGQYWPTEYRRAAAAAVASTIWDYWRNNCMPEPVVSDRPMPATRKYEGLSAGDWLRRHARQELGCSIAARWFR